jgi:iron complex outermembrane receptor protein
MAHMREMSELGLAGRRLRALLLTTAMVSAGTAIAMANPAFAADAPPPADTSTGLEEVTVTARKTTENLQQVPVSASVLSNTQLQQENLLNFYDLRGAIPDLTTGLSQGGAGISITLRGFSSAGALVQTDAKIGLYVDDMYIARAEGNSLMFYDQSSLQVLYGPQGTLFGRNTSGGALQITPTLPSANGASYAQVTAGTYDTVNFEGGINVPITDTLFTRFSFRTESSAGYITHLLDSGTSDNIDDQSFRGQLRWQPTDKFTADLLYEHDQSHTNGQASTFLGCSPKGYPAAGYGLLTTGHYNGADYCGGTSAGITYAPLYTPLANKYEVYGGDIFQGPTSTLKNSFATGGDYTASGITPFYHGGPFTQVHADSFIMHLSYELTPDITVKSITTNRQSRERDFNSTIDAPIDPYQQYNDQGVQATSQEFNLTGKAFGSRLKYVGGFYYYNMTNKSLQFDGTDYCDVDGWNDVEIDKERSYAFYGQVDFDLTDKLQLEVGGRYTNDYKYALGNITAYEWDNLVPPAAGFKACGGSLTAFELGSAACANALQATNHATWTNFNPEGAITYKITPDFIAYATIRSSYDEGGFNAHSLSTKLSNAPPLGEFNGVIPGFQPDHLVDYEVGLKTEWFDHTLRVDVDGYYEKYQNLVSTVLITVNGISTRNSQNAGDAHFDGFDGQLDWAPTRDFRMSVNGDIFQAAYDSILPAAVSTTFNLSTPIVGVVAPGYSYAVSGSYTLHPYKAAMLTVALNYKAQGSLLGCQIGANYTCTLPAYGLLGGRADMKISPDSPWTISAYVTNALNTYFVTGETRINTVTPNMGIASDSPGPPRMAGVIIKRTF